MGLLQEIIEGARQDSVKVSELLRSLQVVARRSNAPKLAGWVLKERDGYGQEDQLPDYRGPHEARVVADFSGPFNSQIRNLDIGKGAFPEDYARGFELDFRQPMAELESLLDGDQNTFSVPWPGDLIAMANGLIDRGDVKLIPMHGLVSVDRRVPRTLLVRIVDRVRSNVLDLALELEALDPALGSNAGASSAITTAVIDSAYNSVMQAEETA